MCIHDLHRLREGLHGVLVQVGDGNPGRERCVVGVGCGHGGGGLGGELVELGGGDAPVDAGADLLRDEDGVAVVLAEAVGELLEPRRDLVEVDGLLPPVALHHVHRAARPGLPSNTWRARIAAGGACLGTGAEGGMRGEAGGQAARDLDFGRASRDRRWFWKDGGKGILLGWRREEEERGSGGNVFARDFGWSG